MKRTSWKPKHRSGAVLICVLACLGIVIAMVMSTVQSSLRGRLAARQQKQLLQTEHLCEAGVKRAVQQFAKSNAYRGETWAPKSAIESFRWAIVEIKIAPTPENSESLTIDVVASLASAADSNDRMQRTHSFTIDLPTSASEQKE